MGVSNFEQTNTWTQYGHETTAHRPEILHSNRPVAWQGWTKEAAIGFISLIHFIRLALKKKVDIERANHVLYSAVYNNVRWRRRWRRRWSPPQRRPRVISIMYSIFELIQQDRKCRANQIDRAVSHFAAVFFLLLFLSIKRSFEFEELKFKRLTDTLTVVYLKSNKRIAVTKMLKAPSVALD